jgi:hypothetical protein
MTDDEAIAKVEETLEREAACDVRYHDDHPAGWLAVAIPKAQVDEGHRAVAGAREATGATKREAAEALLARWQADIRSAGEPPVGG